MRYIRFFDELAQPELQIAGGKGASLVKLTQAGFPIPPGFVITTDAYNDFHSQSFPQTFQEELFKAFEKLNTSFAAVRSSAIAEDSTSASWAGQLESYLNIDKNHLLEAVKNCWASIHSKRAHMYANEKKVSDSKLLVAVVVQTMINSEASGVMFTANPVTNATDELMIEAGYGLGEMIVQGEIIPDNYLINKHSFQILESSLGNQKTMLIYKDGENHKVTVPDILQGMQILTDKQIKNLAELGKKIENYYGSPQDIEWALEDNNFYIVQSRPITTLTNKH